MQTERSWSLEFFHRLLARGHTQEALGPIFDTAEKNAEAYFQKIAEKYLPKPMLFIKYVFLIFKKSWLDKALSII